MEPYIKNLFKKEKKPMENNELMNVENIEIIDAEVIDSKKTGLSTGVSMLIGAGLTLAVGAGVKLGKKLYADFKEKKALRKPDKEINVEPEQVKEVAEPEA
jgi:hypothetical protein